MIQKALQKTKPFVGENNLENTFKKANQCHLTASHIFIWTGQQFQPPHDIYINAVWFYQSLLKTSPVTRRPSLKRCLGIQEQLLSLCMGTHQILQNCSLCLRLNFIFEITNEIWQQLCHKCCFFCSNSVIKSLFLRLDQSLRMHSPERESQSADCFYSNRDF